MRICDWSSDVCSSDLPSISEMARAGLAGLQQIEPKLSVVRGEERIRVVVGGQRIDSVPTPPEGDADAWGWTVARLIESARGMSANLGSAPSEKIYAAVFNGFARQIGRASCRERVCQYV